MKHLLFGIPIIGLVLLMAFGYRHIRGADVPSGKTNLPLIVQAATVPTGVLSTATATATVDCCPVTSSATVEATLTVTGTQFDQTSTAEPSVEATSTEACCTPTQTLTVESTQTATATEPIGEVTATATDDLVTETPTLTATEEDSDEPTLTPTPTATEEDSDKPTLTPTLTVTPQTDSDEVLEPFEAEQPNWKVLRVASGEGAIARSTAQAAAGSASARLSTTNASDRAAIEIDFSDPADSHIWQERPGNWYWQRASVYLPAKTLGQLGEGEYLRLAGLWSSEDDYGWFLQLRANGELYVVGYLDEVNPPTPVEFRIYGRFPTDRWVNLEIGLHSQAGQGVKRAFALLIDGDFYGWYHQGRMRGEVYDRAGLGILSTNSKDTLEVFVDQWRELRTTALPGGPDNRSTANLQEQNFRNQSGVQWQIDWSTWSKDLRLDAQHGLYSAADRVQSGRNIERMPSVKSGWAEIEVDWTSGPPPNISFTGAFAGLIGFHKELSREENLEIGPVSEEDGKTRIVYDAWAGGAPIIYAKWELPPATTLGDGRNIPEVGDIMRVRWEEVSATDLNVRVSYYDASTNTWHKDVINDTRNLTAVPHSDPSYPDINYFDAYHILSSMTIDTPFYGVRRFTVGTLETYPEP